jgi:hypothetical protein
MAAGGSVMTGVEARALGGAAPRDASPPPLLCRVKTRPVPLA